MAVKRMLHWIHNQQQPLASYLESPLRMSMCQIWQQQGWHRWCLQAPNYPLEYQVELHFQNKTWRPTEVGSSKSHYLEYQHCSLDALQTQQFAWCYKTWQLLLYPCWLNASQAWQSLRPQSSGLCWAPDYYFLTALNMIMWASLKLEYYWNFIKSEWQAAHLIERQITARLKGDHAKQAAVATEIIKGHLTAGEPKEAWRSLKGWYKVATNRAPKVSKMTLAAQTAESVALYERVTSLGATREAPHPFNQTKNYMVKCGSINQWRRLLWGWEDEEIVLQ